MLLRLVGAARDKFGNPVDPNVFIGWPHLAEFDEKLGLEGRTKAVYEKVWGEAWGVTRALLREIQRESQVVGAQFALFVSPSMLQGDAGAQARVREAFPGVKLDIDRIDREMERFASEIGVPILPVLPAMLEAAARGGEQLYYQFQDEHWTLAGNRVVAEALARGLRQKGLLPAGSASLPEAYPKRTD